MDSDKAKSDLYNTGSGLQSIISEEGNLVLQDCKVPDENVLNSHNLQVPRGISWVNQRRVRVWLQITTQLLNPIRILGIRGGIVTQRG